MSGLPSFLVPFVVAITVPPMLRFMARSAAKASLPDADTSEFVMKPGALVRWVGWIALPLCVFPVLGLLSLTYPFTARSLWPAFVIFIPLFLIFVSPAYDNRRRVYVSSEGLRSFSPWTGTRVIQWSDIESVVYRNYGNKIQIRSRSGARISIPATSMTGFAALESRMARNIDRSIFTDAFDQYRKYVR